MTWQALTEHDEVFADRIHTKLRIEGGNAIEFIEVRCLLRDFLQHF